MWGVATTLGCAAIEPGGAGLLLNEFGGKGILLGGAAGVPPAHFVVIGAGVLGRSAAKAALGMGAQVTLLDVSVAHLRQAMAQLGGGVTTMLSTQPNIEKALSFADIVVGCAAVRGGRAPLRDGATRASTDSQA